MKIRMLVSISRDDFNARLGQELDLDTGFAHDLIRDGHAMPLDTIVLPRAPSVEPSAPRGTIDLADGVNDNEATLAGKALAERKRKAVG